MSINTTPFLHLPQWTAEEKPSFLAEINQGYASIDAGVRANQVAAEAAQTAAEAAKNQADEAVEQGHTNAAGLVTLQQHITEVRETLVNAGQLHTSQVTTKSLQPNITFRSGDVAYNDFTGTIYISFELAAGTFNVNNGRVAIGTLNNLPFTFNNIIGMSTFVIGGNVGNLTAVYAGILYANGDFALISGNDLILETPELLQWSATVPAFKNTATGKNLPSQCIFIE